MSGDQLAMRAKRRPHADRRDDPEFPTQGRPPGTIRTALAAITGAAAIRTLVRHLAARSLGPVGLAITAVQTAVAVRAAVRATTRWRADRRQRRVAKR